MRNWPPRVNSRHLVVAIGCLVALASCKRQPELDIVPAGSSSNLPDSGQPPLGAERTAHGVVMVVLQKGTGSEHPRPTDYVAVKYTGWNRAGEEFEGSGANEALYLDMAEIVPGLAEGLTRMVEGEKRHLWVPADQAYGRRLDFVNAPREEMTFDVELVRIIRLPEVPADRTSPPAEAKKTKSGLVYGLLSKGTGKVHPNKGARVEIRYAMWSADGKMAENSYRGPGTIPAQLPRLMKGWAEGLMLMVEGDKMRLWIPGKLANGDPKPNDESPPFAPPLGPLVIDVELVAILSP
jgi:peptidylprolyl isomerase